MQYDIKLDIGYDYETSVAGGRHLIRVLPTSRPGIQRMIAGNVTVEPTPGERRDDIDFFGNATSAVSFRDGHDSLHIKMQTRVVLERQPLSLDLGPKLDELREQVDSVWSLEPEAPHHFMCASPYVPILPQIAEYMHEGLSPSMTVREAVEHLCRTIYEDFTYDSDATTVDTPAAKAFEQRAGVCQDFTHVMISGLRGLGIPSGYVSGFLRTIPPEGQERLEGADAMHAWVRAWCGAEIGWIEVDPTNGILVEQDHIVSAYGRDYGDVSPVLGMVRLSGAQETTQAVTVVPLIEKN